MGTIGKIIISGIVGTTFMTLYSYFKSKREKEDYLEPRLLNKLIDRSRALPELENKKTNPVGWGLHYGTGILFVTAYRLVWKRMLRKPTSLNIFIAGSLSGFAGIIIWKLILLNHINPPGNDRKGYYRQLFFAHIIFSFFAITSYKVLGKCINFSQDEKTDL